MDIVLLEVINENKIDVLCLQEVDQNIPANLMTIKNFNIEIESNTENEQLLNIFNYSMLS